MKFVSRHNIDLQKWDDLVLRTPGSSVFSLSVYLDEIAENWMVYVDENYTRGIAVPFATRLGVKTCYTPIFITSLNWLGDHHVDFDNFLTQAQSMFPLGNFSADRRSKKGDVQEYVEQIILPNAAIELGSQAKRMLNKSRKKGYRVEFVNDGIPILEMIRSELLPKISSLTENGLGRLEKALDHLNAKNMVKMLSVYDEQTFVGGIFLIEMKDAVLYLKGAFTDEAKKNGAMYDAMYVAIQWAQDSGKLFDFGGSRIAGVRHFNQQLGGNDRVYYFYQWDRSPFWYRILKSLRDLLQKKA